MTNRILATLGIFASLTSTSLLAQSDPITFTVPFAFRAGTSLLPAGQYKMTPMSQGNILLIRSIETGKSMMVGSFAVSGTGDHASPTLQFTRYDDSYFLEQVWTPGLSQGRQLPKSKVELEMARQASTAPPVLVALHSH